MNSQSSNWKRIVRLMQNEPSQPRLQLLACMLEEAIFERQQELAQTTGDIPEKLGLRDAIEYLNRVRVEKLGFPDWQKRTG